MLALSDLKNRLPIILGQTLVAGAVIYFALTLFHNTQANLEARNIASGYGFMAVEGGLPINDTLLPYSPSDSYGYAFLIGVVNTLYVSIFAIFLSTLLGVIIGCARVSTNWLVSRLATVYVEVLRNIPLLLTLFLCYSVVLASLPHPRKSLTPVAGVFLNNRGLFLPRPQFHHSFWLVAGALALALALSIFSFLPSQEKAGPDR